MKKKILLFILLVLSIFMFSACTDSSKVVKVYNWGDYIDENVIEEFEKETGYKVIYNMFETNEDMYTKLVNSNEAYDVVIPSDYMIERMIDENLLSEINFENIPEYVNIDEQFKNLSYDPENKYSVPYTWGTVGILYNTKMVNGDITSWKDLWDEQYSGNMLMLNSQRDSIGITLKMLGYSLNSSEEKELNEAKDALIEQSPLVLAYVVDEGKDKMIAGEAALALAWAGDAMYCKAENSDLNFIIPKEGSNIYFDSMVIPKNCANKEGAEAFINFMCKPEIAAANALYTGYSSPSTPARALMGEIGQDPIAYPDIEKYDLEIFTTLGDKVKIYDKLWTEITSSF